MAVTGYLSEFSLAELFNFLEQGSKTGLLTLCTLSDAQPQDRENHYIWFNQGRIVAAANRLDQHGLAYMIGQRGWLGEHTALRVAQTCNVTTPIGLSLKTQGLLTVEQLKLLFYTQVMRQDVIEDYAAAATALNLKRLLACFTFWSSGSAMNCWVALKQPRSTCRKAPPRKCH